ncbi:MAG: hypothetical protein ACJ74Y_00985 [Bryobacteraceae bacterium]
MIESDPAFAPHDSKVAVAFAGPGPDNAQFVDSFVALPTLGIVK